ncbi:major facilitator superfamily protein [Sarocladium implicatum]|nr:major facilitator superfamily protein [Sarocladium implicatum]
MARDTRLHDDERAPLLAASEQQAGDNKDDARQYATITEPGKQTLLVVDDIVSTSSSSSDGLESSTTDSTQDQQQQQKEEDAAISAVIWTVFPILLAGIALSNIISSIVLATNQHIASSFNALSSSAWLLTTYTLAQSASQPLYGKLSDIFGRRACLVFCWTVFGTGCLLSGLGTRYWHVILGRAVSGVGSAGKIALTSVIVADIVPLRNVATYRSYVNLMATVARSMGGPIGGWLAGTVGWRWPFIVQFPIAILGLMLVLWKLPEPSAVSKVDASSVAQQDKQSGFARVDLMGAGSLVATIIAGMLALDLASKGYPLYVPVVMGVLFILFFCLFIFVERSYAKEPILPLSLIGRRDVLSAYLAIALQAAAQFGLLYSIPIYFQVAMSESVSRASTRIVPVVVGNALGTVVAGRLISKSKRYKGLMAFANCTGLAGFTLVLLRWHGSTGSMEALYVLLPGVGMGIVQATSFMHLAASVDHDEIAIAGTAWFLAQNVGVLVGASLSTALINKVLRPSLEQALEGEDDAAKVSSHRNTS